MGRGGKRVSTKLKSCTCTLCETVFTVCSVGATPKYCSAECQAKSALEKRGTSLNCKHCGERFVSLKSDAQYCSKTCYGRANTKTEHYRTKHRKICPVCDREFGTITRSQIHCSPECGRKAGLEKLKKYYSCQHCGAPFWRPNAFRLKYCSTECMTSAIHQRTIERHKDDPQPIVYKRTCPECGSEFTTVFPAHIYCSRPCSYSGNLRLKRDQWAKDFIPKSFACKECGTVVTTACGDMRSAFCCQSCANKNESRAERATERHKDYMRRYKKLREKQLAAAYVEEVNYDEIFERDRGICSICGLPALKDKFEDNNWSGTIDHIIPLSEGGKHAMSNCQLAHRVCNSLKSNSIGFEGVDWEEKAQTDNYWLSKYQHGIRVLGLAD